MKKVQPDCPQLIFRCGLVFVIFSSVVIFILLSIEENMSGSPSSVHPVMVKQPASNDSSNLIRPVVNSSHIHVAMVACGNESRLNDTLISVKSILLLAINTVHIHLFVDQDKHQFIIQRLSEVPDSMKSKFRYSLYPSTYPVSRAEEWRAIFKPCSSLRLFLPDLLTDVELVIYLDSDTLSLAPIDHLYSFFLQFNESHSMALAPESLDPSTSWYKNLARHPYYPPLGLNSAVMLMNLTSMRSGSWSRDMVRIYQEYKLSLVYGDQDIINIWLHKYPEQAYVLGCEYNYIAAFCAYRHLCRGADRSGVKIAHGIRGNFHRQEHPVFYRLYQVFNKWEFPEDLRQGVLNRLIAEMNRPPRYGCGAVASLFYKAYETFLNDSKL